MQLNTQSYLLYCAKIEYIWLNSFRNYSLNSVYFDDVLEHLFLPYALYFAISGVNV